jgi:TolA-binding protein
MIIYLKSMKSAVKNNFIILLALLLGGCGGYLPTERTHWPINQEERHLWYSPDETALSARKANQIWLDGLTQEIEILFANYASFSKRERSLFESVNQVNPKIDLMNSNYSQQIESEHERTIRMQKDLKMSKIGFIGTEAKLKKIMAVKPPTIFSIADYNSAVKSFKNGQFKKSLKLFSKLKKQNPPLFLRDNIQFAMGSANFRLKKYLTATKHFQNILDNYAQGDKRFISYFMLGIIHNRQGEKSRAIFLLEEALGENPPEKMLNMIHRLINIVNDETPYAAG